MRLVAEDVRLSALWHTLMPEPLAGHTRPVAYARGQLTLHAESAAWASRVRQQKQALCERLRREPFFASLVDINVRIVPPGAAEVFRPISKKNRTARFSPGAIELLRSTARSTRDPALAAALDRLVRTAAATRNDADGKS